MSIDPITLPDGTAVETSYGRLCFKDGEGLQDFRQLLGDGHPARWGDRTIARVFVPVPDGMTYADAEAALSDAGAWVEVPDQEVPRDEWANIKPGSRVRIVEVDGDEHTVTVDYVSPAADVVWLYDEDHDYDGAKIARVYLLDAPTPPDPDAELVEKMARAAWETQEGCDWADVSDGMRRAGLDEARAALAIVREHEATR